MSAVKGLLTSTGGKLLIKKHLLNAFLMRNTCFY